MQAHPEITGLGSWATLIDQRGEAVRTARRPVEHEEICAHLLFHNPFLHTSAFFRTRAVDKVGGYREDLTYAQDYELWWRLGQVGRLAVIPEVLVKRRRRTPGGIADRHVDDQTAFVCQIACEVVQKDVGLKGPQLVSYERLFWTLHGQPERWQTGDARALRPLWGHLARRPAYRRAWGPLVTRLACRVVAYEPGEGLQLAWAASRHLRWPEVWPAFLRAWGERYAPPLAVKTYRSLRRALAGN
jgi:hypothetical protein